MVIRKPYAFLIKNFKKIHIALLLFSLYIYYKVIKTNQFVGDFISLGAYNESIDSITKYITSILLIVIVLSFLGNLALILLLRHKDKPWKLYLVPAITYGVLFFILIWARSFFAFYDGSETGADIRLIRDIIFISTIAQFPIVLIYSMRILGLDISRFNFRMDEEYLEMDKEDRQELEINFNIDYHMFIRFFNKAKRYVKYFYLEHKKICNAIFAVIAIIILRKIIVFVFITNKSYKEGQVYNANGYTIVINNSYYSDKDKGGNKIEGGKAFVVVDASLTNNRDERELDLNNFHIIKGIDDYTQESTTYAKSFDDLGKTVDSIQKIKKGQTIRTILIYKVNRDKKVRTNKYVLYYQELNGGNDTHLRKIRLKIKDLSVLSVNKTLKMTDEMPIKTSKYDDAIRFESAKLKDKTKFVKGEIASTAYEFMDAEVVAPEGNKILELEFSSQEIEGKELIDFSSNYGKIKYDDNNKDKVIKIKSAVGRKYYGKNLYILVPNTIESVDKIELIYTIRDKRYTIKLSKASDSDELEELDEFEELEGE